MAKSMLIGFPAGGLEKKLSFRQDKPYATPDCLNVRPQETIEGRERGGSRPGLQGPSGQDLGGEIRLLAPMSLAPGRFMLLRDSFYADELGSEWELEGPDYSGNVRSLPIVGESGLVGTGTLNENAKVQTAHSNTSIDVTRSYTISIYVAPHEGRITNSHYEIHARMSTVDPNWKIDGIRFQLQLINTPATRWYFNWWSQTSGSITDFGRTSSPDNYAFDDSTGSWFRATFSGNSIVSASFQGTTETINMAHDNHAGTRIGFDVQAGENEYDPPTPPYNVIPAWISMFEAQYFSSSSSEPPLNRTLLVASANGNLFEEWSSRE